MKKSKPVAKLSQYEELKEYICDYIRVMDGVNQERVYYSEKELSNVMKECQAFNMLQKNISGMNIAIP